MVSLKLYYSKLYAKFSPFLIVAFDHKIQVIMEFMVANTGG